MYTVDVHTAWAGFSDKFLIFLPSTNVNRFLNMSSLHFKTNFLIILLSTILNRFLNISFLHFKTNFLTFQSKLLNDSPLYFIKISQCLSFTFLNKFLNISPLLSKFLNISPLHFMTFLIFLPYIS